MDITAIAGCGIIAAVLCVIIRQYKPEMAIGVSVGSGVLIMLAVLALLKPSIETLLQLSDVAGMDKELCAVLMKALAVCYITQLASDCCRDAGETAIATKLELAGRAAVLTVSLPVFVSLAELITKLLAN